MSVVSLGWPRWLIEELHRGWLGLAAVAELGRHAPPDEAKRDAAHAVSVSAVLSVRMAGGHHGRQGPPDPGRANQIESRRCRKDLVGFPQCSEYNVERRQTPDGLALGPSGWWLPPTRRLSRWVHGTDFRQGGHLGWAEPLWCPGDDAIDPSVGACDGEQMQMLVIVEASGTVDHACTMSREGWARCSI